MTAGQALVICANWLYFFAKDFVKIPSVDSNNKIFEIKPSCQNLLGLLLSIERENFHPPLSATPRSANARFLSYVGHIYSERTARVL